MKRETNDLCNCLVCVSFLCIFVEAVKKRPTDNHRYIQDSKTRHTATNTNQPKPTKQRSVSYVQIQCPKMRTIKGERRETNDGSVNECSKNRSVEKKDVLRESKKESICASKKKKEIEMNSESNRVRFGLVHSTCNDVDNRYESA